jgi:hypothetical protein
MDPLVKEIKSKVKANLKHLSTQQVANCSGAHSCTVTHHDIKTNSIGGRGKIKMFVLFNIQRQVLLTFKIQSCCNFPSGSTAQHACMLLHQAITIIIHGLHISIKLKT